VLQSALSRIRVSLSHSSPSLVTAAAPFSGELFFSDLVHGVRQWWRCQRVPEVQISSKEFAVPICSSLLVVREGWCCVVAADAEARRWRCGGSAVVA